MREERRRLRAEKMLKEAEKEIDEELERARIKRIHAVNVHARYIPEKNGFLCGFAGTEYGSMECESKVYDWAGIIKHLKTVHNIEYDEQVIENKE